MKRIVALTTIAMFLLGSVSYASTDSVEGTITDSETTITQKFVYNAFGDAVSGESIRKNEKRIEGKGEDGSGWETVVTIVKTLMGWFGGLKAYSSHTNTEKTGSDGSSSEQNIYDTFNFNNAGRMTGADRTGDYEGKDSSGKTQKGVISGDYTIKDQQAVLTLNKSVITTKSKTWQTLSTSTNETKYTQLEYKGGSWAAKTATTNYDLVPKNNDGESKSTTKVTTTNRDSYGLVSGMSVKYTFGEWFSPTANNGTGQHRKLNLNTTEVTISRHSEEGFYISDETLVWDDV